MKFIEVPEEKLTVKQLRYLAYCPSRKHLNDDEYLEFVEKLKDLPSVLSDEEVECMLQLQEVGFNHHGGKWCVTYNTGRTKHTVVDIDKGYAAIWVLIDAHHEPSDNGSYWVPELLC